MFAKNTQAVNGAVRVDDGASVSASILLKSHYFFNDSEEKKHPPLEACSVRDNSLWRE